MSRRLPVGVREKLVSKILEAANRIHRDRAPKASHLFLDPAVMRRRFKETLLSDRAAFTEWTHTMHLQNTSGRETPEEMFLLGIEAAWEEMRALDLPDADPAA
jgi:hypothetical protein